jgi:PAS domain S-box-containing protein
MNLNLANPNTPDHRKTPASNFWTKALGQAEEGLAEISGLEVQLDELRDWNIDGITANSAKEAAFPGEPPANRLLGWLREINDLKVALNEHAGVAMIDPQRRITFVNDNFCLLSRYSRAELFGQDYGFLSAGNRTQESFSQMWAYLTQGKVWRGDLELLAKNGTSYWVAATVVPLMDSRGNARRYVAIQFDVTGRRVMEKESARFCAEANQLKERSQIESDYLNGEAIVNQRHLKIVGRSPAIKRVLHKVEQVAPADSAVLISGETGTGKELIAQEIHRLSKRWEHSMVLVNCAALPSGLVESELFGRERGAYTGALSSQIGRFELGNGSTIFLDEVGELSLEVQAKLLRVLQEGEFQRLGSSKTHKVDVRVIAATNRDLGKEVRKGAFREDLYYRLSVFPIHIPPLRERVEDIPLLAFAFMEEFSTRMGKKITKMSCKAMEALQRHTWPGNIRELRNVIEHSVIISSGDMLKLSFIGESPTRDARPMTLSEAEREHILKTLESTGWRIKGPYGAAVRLDLQPSTLYSRMQKLGIPHRRQRDKMRE